MRYLYFLQQFFEKLPTPAFIKDNKGRYLWINKELENVLGLPEEKVVGKKESEILGVEEIDEIDKKVMKNRRNQSHELMIAGRHYNIQRMPIRLGTGGYGVAGLMYDITEKILERTLYKLLSFVEQKILESLGEAEGDLDKFVTTFSRKFHAEYPHTAVVLLKDNEYLIGSEDYKLIEKVKQIDEVKTFTHEKQNYQVIPIENFKFVVHVPEHYLSLAKALSSFLASQVLAAMKVIENQRMYKDIIEKFDSIIRIISLWNESNTLEEYLERILDDLVKLVPETQKASIWLLEKDTYKCVAVHNYDDEVKNVLIKASDDNYGPNIGENKVVELLDAYRLNLESKQREMWERAGVTTPNFIPLVGSVRVGDKKVIIISLDNFEGQRFSETSKKVLQILVELLSAFLSGK
ncbi:PAS domain-containing protein [Fervidobacterium gondwanense]|uniref:PAS domain-containing protein n=1 Tax=Fervidobacterium gondwanense TaxID=44754 RepID=UPI003A7A7CE2